MILRNFTSTDGALMLLVQPIFEAGFVESMFAWGFHENLRVNCAVIFATHRLKTNYALILL